MSEVLHLIVTYTSQDGKEVKFYERVSGNTLVQLMAKFNLTVAKLAEQITLERMEQQKLQLGEPDDIPF